MNYDDIGHSVALHVKPYLDYDFTAIDIYCDYSGRKPDIRCFQILQSRSEPSPMWSTDMMANLRVDFENFQRVSTKHIVKVHFHAEKSGQYYFKYDYQN